MENYLKIELDLDFLILCATDEEFGLLFDFLSSLLAFTKVYIFFFTLSCTKKALGWSGFFRSGFWQLLFLVFFSIWVILLKFFFIFSDEFRFCEICFVLRASYSGSGSVMVSIWGYEWTTSGSSFSSRIDMDSDKKLSCGISAGLNWRRYNSLVSAALFS